MLTEMGWGRHSTHDKDEKRLQNRYPGGRTVIGRTRRKCENNIKIVLQDTVSDLH